jgi:hypothetical protein
MPIAGSAGRKRAQTSIASKWQSIAEQEKQSTETGFQYRERLSPPAAAEWAQHCLTEKEKR